MEINVHTKRPDTFKVKITPAMAAEWLDLVPVEQRILREYLIRNIATAIMAGQWINHTGDTIKFDTNGACFDGQHRLHGIVRAQKSVVTSLAVGCPPESIMVVDRDMAKKTMADLLRHRGEGHANLLAGGLGWLWRYRTDNINSQSSPTSQELIEVLEAEPEIRNWMATAHHCSPILPGTPCLAILHLAGQHDAEAAAAFAEKLHSGTGLSRKNNTSGILLLRDMLIKAKARRLYTIGSRLKLILGIKAWNAFHQGCTIKVLRWVKSEDVPKVR